MIRRRRSFDDLSGIGLLGVGALLWVLILASPWIHDWRW